MKALENKSGLIQESGPLSREQFYTQFILTDTPVIIKNMINWPAITTWSLDYLADKIGERPIRYRISPSHLHPDLNSTDTLSSNDIYRHASLRQFITLLARDDNEKTLFLAGDDLKFFANNHYQNALAAIRNDVDIPTICNLDLLHSSGLWLSRKNIISWLHYDQNGCHNLNAQIQGEKKVLLFPPHQAKYYYLHQYSKGNLANFSQVNIDAPDYQTYPLFKQANYFEGQLAAGDLLYIPAYWLHSFQHLGEININVNVWWDEKIQAANPLQLRQQFFDSVRKALAAGTEKAIYTLLEGEALSIQLLIEKIERQLLAI